MPSPTTQISGSLGIVVKDLYFTKQITVTNAASYTLLSGTLPTGVEFFSNGTISGTPRLENYVSSQPIYNFNIRVRANLNNNTTSSGIYSISVVTTGLFTPDSYDQRASVTGTNGYQYQLPDIYQISDSTFWRLKWGSVPPNTYINQDGLIEVDFTESIKPLVREDFLLPNAPYSQSLSQQSFDAWLDDYFSQAHALDYQFVVELADDSDHVISAHTVRIIHTKVPATGNTWFSENAAYITYDPDQYYYIIVSSVSDNIIWYQNNDLGTVINGTISEVSVEANIVSSKTLGYRIRPNHVSALPQGVQLLNNGLISGKFSFRCYEDDPSNIPVDDIYNFTVRASTNNDRSYADRTFSLAIKKVYAKPTDNLYIRSFPKFDEREYYVSLLSNPDIFPNEARYRYGDPWWAPPNSIRFLFATGLNHKNYVQYESALLNNHYQKELLFNQLKTAYKLDDELNVVYEVVYLTVKDPAMGYDAVTKIPTAQPMTLDLRPYIKNYYVKDNVAYYEFRPNGLENLRSRITSTIGVLNSGQLPSWMTSLQPIPGKIGEFFAPIGYIPAVVLAYTKPGQSRKIVYNLRNTNFNYFRFEFDRFQWQDEQSRNYDFVTNRYKDTVATQFDSGNTRFDLASTKFVDNLEYAVLPETNDKYVKFPKLGVFT